MIPLSITVCRIMCISFMWETIITTLRIFIYEIIFFNYVIPNVLNASLVLYFFCNDPEENSGRNYLQKGILFTAVYMGIFSNLFQEVVLVSFIGCRLVLKLIEMVKSNRTIPQYIKENKVSLSIIAAWLLTCIFEANGGRARSLTSVKMDVFTTVKNLIAWKDKLNKLCVAVCILLILAGVFTYIKSNKKDPVIESYKKIWIAKRTNIFNFYFWIF